jgi:hypothetical protein
MQALMYHNKPGFATRTLPTKVGIQDKDTDERKYGNDSFFHAYILPQGTLQKESYGILAP